MTAKKKTPDMWLLLLVLFLTGVGVIMVFSASYYDTLSIDPYYYLKKQGSFALVGIAVMLVAMQFPYQKIRFFCKPLFLVTLALLVIVFLFDDTKNTHRWIPLGLFNLQPSEVAKFTIALYLADILSRRNATPNSLQGDLGRIIPMVGLVLALVYLEPDLGATVTLAGIAAAVLIAGGLKWRYLIATGFVGGAGLSVLVMNSSYQMRRLRGFIDPWSDPLDKGYQLINSYYALGSGGFWGMGIGNSRQKLGFLPEQNTDFIFSIIGEELGFIGAGFIVILFLLLTWRGYMIAARAKDAFGSLLAVGITTGLAFQAALNLCVVTGLIPVTGIALPFLSYGGSSLIMSLGSIGVLLSISRYPKSMGEA